MNSVPNYSSLVEFKIKPLLTFVNVQMDCWIKKIKFINVPHVVCFYLFYLNDFLMKLNFAK